MKYLRSLSTQMRANFYKFFSLFREKYPFHRPLCKISISKNPPYRNLWFLSSPHQWISSHAYWAHHMLAQKQKSCMHWQHAAVYLPMAANIEHYLSNMQQFIIFFRRMKVFFTVRLEKIQLHLYYINSIRSILDITTIFKLYINCKILWQNGIYPVLSNPIPPEHGFIHTYGIWRMIVLSTNFVEVGRMSINNHLSIMFQA